MKFYNKFGFKLLMSILVLALIPLIITMFISYTASKGVVEQDVNDINRTIVEGYKSTIHERMKGASSVLVALSKSDTIESMNPEQMSDTLMELVASNEVISQIYVMQADGMQIFKTSGELGDRKDRGYFQKAMEGEYNYSDVIISGSTGKAIIVYASPIYSDGKVIGVIGASIDLSFINQLIQSDTVDEGAYAYIVDQNGIVLAHPDQSMVENQTNLMELLPVQEVVQGKSGESEYTYEGEEKLASYVYLDITKWGLIFQEPSKIAFMSVRELLRLYGIIGLITALVVIAGAVLFARMIKKPIVQLEKNMVQASNGQLNIQMNPALLARKDEFGHLGISFNEMITALHSLLTESVKLTDQVTNVADQLAGTSDQTKRLSDEITNAVDEIAKGASEQADESEKGVTITQGFSEQFSELGKLSHSVNENVSEVIEVNELSYGKIESLEKASKESLETTSRVEHSIEELSKKSVSISEILGTISTIAAQTNLLALNASIEAARAGEHGKGFAVVADEIRKLAEGSQEATNEIGDIIGSIQSEISQTVSYMQDVTESSKIQSVSVTEVNEAFKVINNSVQNISLSIKDIDSSVIDLIKENNLVVDSISTISAVTEETAAATQQVTASVDEQYSAVEEVALESARLHDLAVSLKEEIEKFEL